MLHMRAKVHSPTPTPGRRSQGRLINPLAAQVPTGVATPGK